jgi:uncharacterized protein YbaP (TraB family)
VTSDMRTTSGFVGASLACLTWLGGLATAPVRAEGFTQGLLFEVAVEGAPPSHLFGTIHSADPRVVQLPPPVQAVFDRALGFVMEAIPDSEAVLKSVALMTYADGRSLKQVLPPALYDETVAVMATRGMSEEATRTLKPWALVMLLSAPPSATGEFLDMRLYRAAMAMGKPTVGLETLEEQVALLDGLAEVDQVALLRETLATYPELIEVFHRLVAAYVRRDLNALTQLSDTYQRWGSPELAERFQRVAIGLRNQRMAERMGPLLAEGGRFIAVGALHLPGPGGLLKRLADQGYRIRPVY